MCFDQGRFGAVKIRQDDGYERQEKRQIYVFIQQFIIADHPGQERHSRNPSEKYHQSDDPV